ncbi:MAG: hypothetical protein V1888_04425 [archaeon]
MDKKGLVGLVVVGILLVVGFFWFVGEKGRDEVDEVFCEIDDDCVKVQVGCCPCNMGGAESCVNREFELGYSDALSECSATTICAAVFSCEIESCGCVEGVCVGR